MGHFDVHDVVDMVETFFRVPLGALRAKTMGGSLDELGQVYQTHSSNTTRATWCVGCLRVRPGDSDLAQGRRRIIVRETPEAAGWHGRAHLTATMEDYVVRRSWDGAADAHHAQLFHSSTCLFYTSDVK